MAGPDDETLAEIGPIWRELWGRVWHTTHPDRFLSIIGDGEILTEPPLPDNERWGTGLGPSHYPFVRFIGGVSLFDFRDFIPAEYQPEHPISNWREFVPCQRDWAGAVWLEIDLEKTRCSFISGHDLLIHWKEVDELRRKIMPIIEAAHMGALPLDSIHRALFVRADGTFHELGAPPFNQTECEALIYW